MSFWRNALHLLEQCYDEELSNKTPPTCPIPSLEFPYPLSYTCINTSSIHHFRYLSHMDDSKLLFSAKMADDENICVKFVHHYLKDIHTFCASKGFPTRQMAHDSYRDDWGGLLPSDGFPSSLFPL